MDDKETSYTLGKHSVHHKEDVQSKQDDKFQQDAQYIQGAHTKHKAQTKKTVQSKESEYLEASVGKHSKEYLSFHEKQAFQDKVEQDAIDEILTTLKQENPTTKDTAQFKKVSLETAQLKTLKKDLLKKKEKKQLKVLSKEQLKTEEKSKLEPLDDTSDNTNPISLHKHSKGAVTDHETVVNDSKSVVNSKEQQTQSLDNKQEQDNQNQVQLQDKQQQNEQDQAQPQEQQQSKQQDEQSQEESEEEIEKRRNKLKLILKIAIICLVVLFVGSAIVAVLLANNASKSNDTNSLSSSEQSSQTETFSPIDKETLPSFTVYFNKPITDLVTTYDKRIILNGDKVESGDSEIPALVSLQHAYLKNDQNANIASLAFGLDENDNIVYVYCMADLDAMHIADASFEQLVSDKTLPASFLVACGISQSAANAAALTKEANPDCFSNAKAQESAQNADADMALFSGQTKNTSAPQKWKLTEKYDGSIGKTLGDNSVLRTITVELY